MSLQNAPFCCLRDTNKLTIHRLWTMWHCNELALFHREREWNVCVSAVQPLKFFHSERQLHIITVTIFPPILKTQNYFALLFLLLNIQRIAGREPVRSTLLRLVFRLTLSSASTRTARPPSSRPLSELK